MNPIECITVFLDCIGSDIVLTKMAILDIEDIGHRFVRNVAQHFSSTPAPASAPAPAPAPAPRLTIPAKTLLRISSVIEQRRLVRLAAAGHVVNGSHGAQGSGVQPVTHHVDLEHELTSYRGQNVEADVYGFSLPDSWLRKSEPMVAKGTGELVVPPDLPHLALLARLYHRVEATSCQVATFLQSFFNWHLVSKHAFRMCNPHNRRLLWTRSMSKYRKSWYEAANTCLSSRRHEMCRTSGRKLLLSANRTATKPQTQPGTINRAAANRGSP